MLCGMKDALTKFFEAYPLYKKLVLERQLSHGHRPFEAPSLHMPCLKCNSEQTFVPEGYGHHDRHHPTYGHTWWGDIIEVEFLCASCREYLRYVSVRVSDDGTWIQKTGQYPPWEIAPPKQLARLLETHGTFYKRGLANESQGYGIGAFAYYRRVVEDITDTLLDQIEGLLEGDTKEQYHEALLRTKASPTASEKFELVKNLLPPVLRPGGMDPLGQLYGALSEGLHELTDEQCLEVATEVRVCLEFVVEQVFHHRQSVGRFTTAMQKLLEKRNARRGAQAEETGSM